MICSVTVLGGRGRSASSIATDVVAYLEGRRVERGGSRAGKTTQLPSPEGGTVAYYADSAGEGPGTWSGQGAGRLGLSGEVAGQDLWWVLQGKHPHTHQPLLGAQGSAGRAGPGTVRLDSREWWTLQEAGEVIGVSPAYLRRLADKTRTTAAERAFQLLAGQPLSPAPPPWLVADKHEGAWRVSGGELRSFMANRKPPTVVVGYDVTFSVEKSVSALWARADDTLRSEILSAVDTSVAAGVDYLERHAFRVRVKGTRSAAQGMVAASYLHSTSRAFDPQLHRHVVVANVATGPDGQARALDATSLFHHAKTAGYLAGAELRHQLTARLGVQWTEVTRGLSEVVGVPEAAIEAISTRSREIDAAARDLDAESGGAVGVHSAAARQALALATRAPKEGGVDLEALRSAWTAILTDAGLDEQVFHEVIHRVRGPEVASTEDVAGLFEHLAGAHGVTETQASFDRRHVVQAVSSWSVDRLSAAACQDLADEWLAGPEVVPLRTGARWSSSGDVIRRHDGTVVKAAAEQLFTTRAMLATEARVEATVRQGQGLERAVVPTEAVAAVLERPAFAHLSGEQRALVRHMTTSGHETGLVRGPAGTGKTTAIEASARAWEEAGFRVLGASVNGNAAEHLGRAAGIESSTVEGLLWRLAGGDDRVLDNRTVVVLDEATTLATRDLDQLLRHVHERGAALRLVGDPAQHSAVGAGGAFRWLLEHNPDHLAELTVNRRQVGEHMAEVRLALTEYREGAVAAALDRLDIDQRIVTASSAADVLDALTADWYVDRQRTQADPAFERSSMTAAHHDERRALVARARAMLVADGTLHGPKLKVAGMTFQAGDEVIAKVPDRTLRPEGGSRDSFVKNGTRGTVIAVADDSLVVDFEHRGEIRVPRAYLERQVGPGIRGGLLHSYCLTTYTAQGDTYGAARHLGSDRSTRAELYVGLTRGRHDTKLYAVGREQFVGQVDDDLPRLKDETDAARAMANSAAAGGVERLARELDPMAAEAVVLADRHRIPELAAMAKGADQALIPVMVRAYQLATNRLAAQAVVEPSAVVLAMIGPRPPFGDSPEGSAQEPAPRERWDTAVKAVAVYRGTYEPRPFPGSPTDELVGLSALAPDPDAWATVKAAIEQYLEIAPDLTPAPEPDLAIGVEL